MISKKYGFEYKDNKEYRKKMRLLPKYKLLNKIHKLDNRDYYLDMFKFYYRNRKNNIEKHTHDLIRHRNNYKKNKKYHNWVIVCCHREKKLKQKFDAIPNLLHLEVI